MNNRMRVRALVVVVCFAAGFTAVSARLVWLQVCCHDKYREEALRAQFRVVPTAAERGRILDRQGHIFAQSVTVTDVFLDGKIAAENPASFDEAAALLGLAPESLSAAVDPAKRHVPLARDLDADTVALLKQLRVRWLACEDHPKRVYPGGSVASHVLGFTNLTEEQRENWHGKIITESGAGGVEKMLDEFLAGTAGERGIFRDNSGREVSIKRKTSVEPRNGCDVTLTIDRMIQHAVEEEADKLVKKYDPETLSIIVTRPTTGEILAMVSRPTFDPNDRKTMKPDGAGANMKNRAIGDIYEPGSTFKIVTLSAALSEGIVTLDTIMSCENGSYFFAGKTLTDTHPYDTLSVRRALEVSSNIAFAKLGRSLGQDKLYRQIRAFGFGDLAQDQNTLSAGSKSRLALAGEGKGLLRPTEHWSQLSLTRLPIGYEIGVTNLQMTMAMGAIANGGKLMRPLLVKSVTDSDGRVVREFGPLTVREVVAPEIAADIRGALAGVVSDEGTAEGAKVRGFTAAGKTGTAKKYNHKLRDYERGAYYSSFIGFVPADEPQFLISILVNQPHEARGQIYGGKVAAPAFSAIANKVALQLNMIASEQPRVLAKGGTP